MSHMEVEDPRLGDLRRDSECFMCGHRIVTGGVYVHSPKAGNIRATAHAACVNGLTAFALATKYQAVLDAAIRGGKEKRQ